MPSGNVTNAIDVALLAKFLTQQSKAATHWRK